MSISEEEMAEAIETAILGAEMGETTPLTPVSLGFSDHEQFGDQGELLLRRILMSKFDTVSAIHPATDTICVGRKAEQQIFLLAQTSRQGQVVYLISPSPMLEI